MATFVILLLVVGIVLYYLLVLRRYNSLGFRLFSLFTFVVILLVWWIRQDEQRLKSLSEHGARISATVVSKEKVKGGASNAVTLSWRDEAGTETVKQTSMYVSDPEWESFQPGAPLTVVFDQASKEVFVAKSLERFRSEKWILYAVLGFFFLLGSACWFFLRKYMIHADDAGKEWVEKDGKVVLDERNDEGVQPLRPANIFWRILELFGSNK
ncbi:MAG: DUF3592 domain-containing protein [Roseimicrobium sp.]